MTFEKLQYRAARLTTGAKIRKSYDKMYKNFAVKLSRLEISSYHGALLEKSIQIQQFH